MEKFSDAALETFGKMFEAIKQTKTNSNFETTAEVMLKLSEGYFINLYNDPNNTVTGSEEELKKVKQRALDLKCEL